MIMITGLKYLQFFSWRAGDALLPKTRDVDLGKQPRANLARSRDVVASYLNISHGTLEKLRKIREYNKNNPGETAKIIKSLDEGKSSINYAFQCIKRQEKHSNPPETSVECPNFLWAFWFFLFRCNVCYIFLLRHHFSLPSLTLSF